MGVEFNCPKCQRVLDSDDRAEPDRIVCGGCGVRIKVKAQASPPPPARPPVARRFVPPAAAVPEADDGGFEVVGDAPDASAHGFEVIDEPDPPLPGDPPRPRTLKTEPRRPREPGASRRPPLKLLLAVGGGGLLAVALLGGLLTLVFSGGERDGGGRVQAVAKARPATPKAAVAAAGLESPTIDAASWRVTADPVPVATGLKSAYGVGGMLKPQLGTSQGLTNYADPAAACLVTGWFQSGGAEFLDLREDDSRPLLNPKETRSVWAVALSPSGDRAALLVRDQFVKGQTGHFLILLATADGKWLWHVPVPIPLAENPTHWLGFAGEDRLMVFGKGSLQAYDAKTGLASGGAVALPFTEYPKLSPGRRWLYGRTAGGYEWYDAASLAKAGRLTLPAEWVVASGKMDTPEVALTIDYDGARAVLASTYGKDATIRVALLDLAAGTVTGCKSCRGFNGYDLHVWPQGHWCEGDDKLILFEGGHVLQWEAGRLGMHYREEAHAPFRYTGYAPDRRYWYALSQVKPEFVAKTGSERDATRAEFLAAATLPYAIDSKLLGGKLGGYPWPPGTPLRVESNGDGDAAHHEEVVEIVASGFAAQGYPIDPKAKAGFRVTTGRVTSEPTRKDLTPQEPGYIPPNPGSGYVAYKMVSGLTVDGKVRVIDSSGRLGREVYPLSGGVNGDDRDMLLRTFRSSVYSFASPASVAGGEPDDKFNQRTRLSIGVDGLAEPERKSP